MVAWKRVGEMETCTVITNHPLLTGHSNVPLVATTITATIENLCSQPSDAYPF